MKVTDSLIYIHSINQPKEGARTLSQVQVLLAVIDFVQGVGKQSAPERK